MDKKYRCDACGEPCVLFVKDVGESNSPKLCPFGVYSFIQIEWKEINLLTANKDSITEVSNNET